MRVFLKQSSGTIMQVGMCSDDLLSSQGNVLVIDSYPADPFSFIKENYVSDNTVIPRSVMSPSISKTTFDSDGVDSAVISGLPDPCMVTIQGPVSVPQTQVTGGTITITSNSPGTITVSISADPTYIQWSVPLNAV